MAPGADGGASIPGELVLEIDVELEPDLENGVDDVPVELVDEPPAPAESGVKDIDLASRAASAAHEERAFRALYDQHVAFVWRNLRRLGVMDRDIDDACQEVFVVAHRHFASFVDRGHGPRAWLFQIALRVASDARRHRRRHPVDPDGGFAEQAQFVEAGQAHALAQKEALDLLDRALAAIDVGRRAVVVLHEIEQMSAPEIARTLEIPVNTVYSRLRAGRIDLDAALQRLAAVDEAVGRAEDAREDRCAVRRDENTRAERGRR